MRHVLLLCAASAGCSASHGQAADPSRDVHVRAFPVAGFTGIDLTAGDDVDVHVGSAFSVRADGPADQLERLSITRTGDTLSIGRTNGFSWGRRPPVHVHVTLPRLTGARITGSGNMTIDRVRGAGLNAAIGGSGNLTIGALAVGKAALSISGSGNIDAAGQAQSLAIDVAGSGNVRAGRLFARDAMVSLSGSGAITARVQGPATVSLTGVGNIDLGPESRCLSRQTGSGTVRCGG